MTGKIRNFFIILLLSHFVFLPTFCNAQGQVSRTAPNDQQIHPLTIGSSGVLSGKFRFTVGSDGLMIRIDNVGDSRSNWSNTGYLTSTANFTGTPNAGPAGTFVPNFSGRVRYSTTSSSSGSPPEYEWTAKASYKINAKFNIVLEFDDDFPGRNKTAMGVGEIATVKAMAVNPPGATTTITAVTTTGAISNSGVTITAGDTQGGGVITVKAKIGSSSTEYTETLGVIVIEPSGLVFFQKPGTGVFHTQGVASVGKLLEWQLTPTNISFYKVQTQEWGTQSNGTSQYQFTGFLQGQQQTHSPGAWIKIQKSQVTMVNPLYGKANITMGEDICMSSYTIPLDNNGNSALTQGGGLSITLPWRYRVDYSGTPRLLKTVISTTTIDQNGRTTRNKDGVIFSKDLNDPTSTY